MPRGDGTGPAGLGPMTGRRTGYCAGYAAPGFANAAFGCRTGYGRRTRRMYDAPVAPPCGYGYAGYAPVNEKATLSARADMLEKELGDIKKRLRELAEEE